MSAILTVGYEAVSARDLFACLQSLQVEVLIDVRHRPQSRKPGLSRTSLADACGETGMHYRHIRSLGTPPPLMEQLKTQGHYDLEEYRVHLLEQRHGLYEASDFAGNGRACLLCYEADPSICHRSVVAEELQTMTYLEVQHLDVRVTLGL